jgi:hypothetical protein
MINRGVTGSTSRSALLAFLAIGAISTAALAGDLSGYRNFQFGADPATVAKQTGTSLADATVVDSRPALIQEIEWRPEPLGPSSAPEAAQDVVFSFYNGELFRIVVKYDMSATEGLTREDLIGAISAIYGMPTRPPAQVGTEQGPFGDPDEDLARWQDSRYRFDLIRSSQGPRFSLIGVLKRLEAPAQTAILEAKRLDDQEAPQRDAARLASEQEATDARLEKARLENKAKFQP